MARKLILPPRPIDQDDLDAIVSAVPEVWSSLTGRRIFLTGGTGFFGVWLLESLFHANRVARTKIDVTVLSRSPDRLVQRLPHLGRAPGLSFVAGDVRTLEWHGEQYDEVIHAATPVVARESAVALWEIIVDGTRRVLDFAAKAKCGRLLLTSSGAVYGRQPPTITHMPEDAGTFPGGLDPGSAYGLGKRAAEWLCAAHAQRDGLECKLARCYALVGAHLPLDAHFAMGNFIRDAMTGDEIIIKGDGTNVRSYLYARDLVIWLLKILVSGQNLRPYNVGSDQGISIYDLAATVRRVVGCALPIRVVQPADPGKTPERYVPSVDRARSELGLAPTVELEAAIRRTASWYFA